MNKVWIGWTYHIVEQGYGDSSNSEPLIVFDNEPSAKKWAKLDQDRKVKPFSVKKNAKCDTCGNEV